MVRLGRTPKGWTKGGGGGRGSKKSKPLTPTEQRRRRRKTSKKDTIIFKPIDDSNNKQNNNFLDAFDQLQVGRITTNVISSIYGPMLLDHALQISEQYASDLLEYEDIVRSAKEKAAATATTTCEAVTEDSATKEDATDDGLTTEGNDDSDKNEDIEDEQSDEDVASSVDPSSATTSTCSATILENLDLPSPPKRPVMFVTQQSLDDLHEMIKETSRAVSSAGTWRARANAAKFERMLDEKYGVLRPFFTHPKVEATFKYLQRRYHTSSISVFRQGDPPIAMHTCVIILFMMHRNKVRTDALFLSALFMFVGLEPWALVCLVCLGVHWRNRRLHKILPPGSSLTSPKDMIATEPYYNSTKEGKVDRNELLKTPVGEPIVDKEQLAKECASNKYDVMIVCHGGIDALYCGALLSRMGRKVLVISSEEDASGCVTLGGSSDGRVSNVPFDITDSIVGKVYHQQRLLASALANTVDVQGGIRFATIGNDADGYAYRILNIPGMGGGGSSSDEHGNANVSDDSPPFVLRAGGIDAIAEDASLYLGDGWHTPDDISSTHSSIARYLASCSTSFPSSMSSTFYYSKLFTTEQQRAWATLLGGDAWSSTKNNPYGTASARYASDYLKKLIPFNPHIRSLAAALGCGPCNEDSKANQTSFAVHISHISNIVDDSSTGFAYPIGGPRSLGKALQQTITQNGGKVVTNCTVEQFLFAPTEPSTSSEVTSTEESKEEATTSEQNQDSSTTASTKKSSNKLRCTGVKIRRGDSDKGGKKGGGGIDLLLNGTSEEEGSDNAAVVSFLGMIPTFIRIRGEDRDVGGVPQGLAALKERRPHLHILLALDGSSQDLNLPAADWVRLPSCRLPRDKMDPNTHQIIPGNVGGGDDDDDDNDEDAAETEAVNVVGTTTSGGAESSSTNTAEEVVVGESRSTSSAFGLDGKKGNNKKGKAVKYQTGHSYLKISFPSVKDPSWKERYPNISTCVATIEADDDFCTLITSCKPTFVMKTFPNEQEKQRLVQRVMKDVFEQFPQLSKKNKILASALHGPTSCGLVQNPERFVVKGVQPKTPYKGLYVGGRDLTIDSFNGSIVGAWLAANSVLGYDNVIDAVLLQKNVTTDLERWLPNVFKKHAKKHKRTLNNEQDVVAVPFKPLIVGGKEEEDKNKPIKEEEDVAPAEPSKES